MLDKAIRYPWDSSKELFPGRTKKKASEPEGPEAVIPVISLVALLYGGAETAPGGTRRYQNAAQKPVTVIPTLSRSYAEVSFQLTSVWSSASTVLPPNPAACLRIGVWGKPWDKYANYFETSSPQFHFCAGDKNGLVLRP